MEILLLTIKYLFALFFGTVIFLMIPLYLLQALTIISDSISKQIKKYLCKLKSKTKK